MKKNLQLFLLLNFSVAYRSFSVNQFPEKINEIKTILNKASSNIIKLKKEKSEIISDKNQYQASSEQQGAESESNVTSVLGFVTSALSSIDKGSSEGLSAAAQTWRSWASKKSGALASNLNALLESMLKLSSTREAMQTQLNLLGGRASIPTDSLEKSRWFMNASINQWNLIPPVLQKVAVQEGMLSVDLIKSWPKKKRDNLQAFLNEILPMLKPTDTVMRKEVNRLKKALMTLNRTSNS
jgi:hypothetical protein